MQGRRFARSGRLARCHLSIRCSSRGRPGVGPPPSSARSGPTARSQNRAVAVALVAGLARQKRLKSILLAHRRQREAARRWGSQRGRSLSVSPGPEAFSAATLEIAWWAEAMSRLWRDSPSHRFRERRAGRISLPNTQGPPRGPAGNAAGPGRLAEWEQPLEN